MGCERHPRAANRWYGKILRCAAPGNDFGICGVFLLDRSWSQRPFKADNDDSADDIVYDGGDVQGGACVHCGCAVEECECAG
jgi:hypothetical protein